MTTNEGGHGGTRVVDISDEKHPKVADLRRLRRKDIITRRPRSNR